MLTILHFLESNQKFTLQMAPFMYPLESSKLQLKFMEEEEEEAPTAQEEEEEEDIPNKSFQSPPAKQ